MVDKVYHGSCHCQLVKYTFKTPPVSTKDAPTDLRILNCSCSICSKNGYLLLYILRSGLTVHSGYEEMATYEFDPRAVEHKFCPKCGTSIMIDFKGLWGEGPANDKVGINARTLHPDEMKIEDLDLKSVNGNEWGKPYPYFSGTLLLLDPTSTNVNGSGSSLACAAHKSVRLRRVVLPSPSNTVRRGFRSCRRQPHAYHEGRPSDRLELGTDVLSENLPSARITTRSSPCHFDSMQAQAPQSRWADATSSGSSHIDRIACLERSFCSNFTCCGHHLADLHELLEHLEERHIIVTKSDGSRRFCPSTLKDDSSSDSSSSASPLSSLAPLPPVSASSFLDVDPFSAPQVLFPVFPESCVDDLDFDTFGSVSDFYEDSRPSPVSPYPVPMYPSSLPTSSDYSNSGSSYSLSSLPSPSTSMCPPQAAPTPSASASVSCTSATSDHQFSDLYSSSPLSDSDGGLDHISSKSKIRATSKLSRKACLSKGYKSSRSVRGVSSASDSASLHKSNSGRKHSSPRVRSFKCPTPGCSKSYLNPNGLKYHIEKGTCEVASTASAVVEEVSIKTCHPTSNSITSAMSSDNESSFSSLPPLSPSPLSSPEVLSPASACLPADPLTADSETAKICGP
ncbi:hypothetical protein FISHEDRAFT_68355 [Fistulina hepatica ATCC 64428]|uniref:CENP-V/GFA domain-containing protein n=1 Tax=Fistulina hepatica ATCC 64428 TaxID=1128425 RepID=A0A0D7AT40_9AGAR|nr:hypothetical protein FISHEDRAFT_68355 [Fistulina hepatica ATCC 64428]